MIEAPLPLAALIVGMVALAFWLEGRFRWARQTGASIVIIALGAVASNTGFVVPASPVYDALSGPVTSLAIVWLLFGVKLSDLRDAGPRMISAFGLSVAATATAAFVAVLLFRNVFEDNAWRLAGVLTGTYSGGSLNFVGVGRAVELPESLFVAASAADNLVTALWMGATIALPLWLGRFYPSRRREAAPQERSRFHHDELHALDLAALIALGLALLWIADLLAGRLGGPPVLWLTTVALATAQVPAVHRLRGSLLLGGVALNLFFAVIGIGSRIAEILTVGLEILWLTLLVVAIHGLLVYGLGRALRFDIETLSVASQAAIGGPSSAVALTTARNWHDLTLPGAAVGLLGYAVGTYLGLAIAGAMRALVGS